MPAAPRRSAHPAPRSPHAHLDLRQRAGGQLAVQPRQRLQHRLELSGHIAAAIGAATTAAALHHCSLLAVSSIRRQALGRWQCCGAISSARACRLHLLPVQAILRRLLPGRGRCGCRCGGLAGALLRGRRLGCLALFQDHKALADLAQQLARRGRALAPLAAAQQRAQALAQGGGGARLARRALRGGGGGA